MSKPTWSNSEGGFHDALGKTSRDPLKHVVNTHWHFDHTGGNCSEDARLIHGAAIPVYGNS